MQIPTDLLPLGLLNLEHAVVKIEAWRSIRRIGMTMRYVKIAEHYKVEAVERLREVSRTADTRSGEEAGDRDAAVSPPEFSHSAGKGFARCP